MLKTGIGAAESCDGTTSKHKRGEEEQNVLAPGRGAAITQTLAVKCPQQCGHERNGN